MFLMARYDQLANKLEGNVDALADIFDIGCLSVKLVPVDITSIPVDVVVSSDDTNLSMGGGVSKRIFAVGGAKLRDSALTNNTGLVGDIIVGSAGKLQAQRVFHAIVHDWATAERPDGELVKELTLRCLEKANEMGFSSIAIPPLAAGTAALAPIEWAPEDGQSLESVSIATKDRLDFALQHFIRQLTHREAAQYYEKTIIDLQSKLSEYEVKENVSFYEALPHPIAFQRKKADIGMRSEDRVRALNNCIEVLVRYLVILMLSYSLEKQESSNHKILSELKRKVSFGRWVGLLREESKDLSLSSGSLEIKLIRDFFDADLPKGKKQVRLFLNRAVEIRNKLQHPPGGISPSERECVDYENELREQIDHVLENLVRTIPWELVMITNILDIGKSGLPKLQVRNLTGSGKLFGHEEVYLNRLANIGETGVLDKENKLFLPLDPYIRYQECNVCHAEDVFFIDHLEEKELKGRWWSFTDGHVLSGLLG